MKLFLPLYWQNLVHEIPASNMYELFFVFWWFLGGKTTSSNNFFYVVLYWFWIVWLVQAAYILLELYWMAYKIIYYIGILLLT